MGKITDNLTTAFSQDGSRIYVLFSGEFSCPLNSLGHLIIPAEYSPGLFLKSVVLMKHPEKYPALTAFYSAAPPFDANDLKKIFDDNNIRMLAASSHMAPILDKSQRRKGERNTIAIPKALREYIGVTKDCTEAKIVGLGKAFEIWSPENWRRHKELILERHKRIDQAHPSL